MKSSSFTLRGQKFNLHVSGVPHRHTWINPNGGVRDTENSELWWEGRATITDPRADLPNGGISFDFKTTKHLNLASHDSIPLETDFFKISGLSTEDFSRDKAILIDIFCKKLEDIYTQKEEECSPSAIVVIDELPILDAKELTLTP